MKHLLLMRHAKSSWGDEGLPDFERPLNHRGEGDAVRIATELKKRHAVPDLIYCSPAIRAKQTAERMRSGGLGEIPLTFEPSLYGAYSSTILTVIQKAPESCDRLLVIAHNPGMGELVESLTGECPEQGMKTATIACIEIPHSKWEDVDAGELKWMLYPRDSAD